MRVAIGVTLLFVGLRFYPFVRFAPDTVRWRNWFRCKEIPVSSIKGLSIENYNHKAWVPVVVAETGADRTGRSNRFVATFSYRRSVAMAIASEMRSWAGERAIPCHVSADRMYWRRRDPDAGA